MTKKIVRIFVPRDEVMRKRIIKYSVPVPIAGCWLWERSCNLKGYGWICTGTDKGGIAHRVSYKLFVGTIPDGMHVLHRCDVPSCVNPAHLFLGTNLDNRADSVNKGRVPSGSLHWNSKLSDEEVHAVRTGRELARIVAQRYGISRSAVYLIRKQKRRPPLQTKEPDMSLKQLGMSTIGVILLILLVLLLLGAWPAWSHGGFGYGYGASGLVAVLIIVLVVLIVTGRL